MPHLSQPVELNSAWLEPDQDHHDGDGNEKNPFLWVMVRMLRDFAKRVATCEFGMRIDFQHALCILVHAGMSTEALAQEFGTTSEMVHRWADGRSSPTPLLRPSVIKGGLNLLILGGMVLAGKVYDPITGQLREKH